MLIIGLMSGTSLDGIDACLAEIHGVGDRVRWRVRHFLTMPLPAGLRERIEAQLDPSTSRLDAAARLNVELGEAFADAARAVAAAAGVPLSQIDAIGSHGQTLWHEPAAGVTLQLGEPSVIAVRTGVTTVGNFRPADLALGGQGAPLVPYVDRVLFGGGDRPVALLNLGGIGNVTVLPGAGGGSLAAFDTGPANMVIDAFAHRASGGALRCDLDGRLARSGRVDAAWLAELMTTDAYLAAPPPKSTGRERYGEAFAEAAWARAMARGLSGADAVATVTAYTAATVADQVARFLSGDGAPASVLVSGGGARNPALMAMLAERLAPVPVGSTEAIGLDPDAKEALAFAVLAHQTLVGQPNVAPEATGAREPWVLGQIAPGRNFERVVLSARGGAGVATEATNALSRGLDTLGPDDAVAVMYAQDYDAVRAVGAARPAIADAVRRITEAFRRGGRLFYVGAGTSGRLGVLDASECPPTFSADPERVQGLIAGGEHALRHAVEGAEDDAEAGARAVTERGVGPLDVVVGLSANGGAPYVRGALEAARRAGATTAIVTCNPVPETAFQPDVAIVLPVGPEVVAGSTRLKAGTATKLVLNMLSTLSMVGVGKVYDNLMVDVRVSNQKLAVRARRLVERLTGLGPGEAERLLAAADGRVKRAVVMHHRRVDAAGADALLAESGDRLRPWMPEGAPA